MQARSPVSPALNGAPRPFLRWAGGKSKLASAIGEFAPTQALYDTYWEPFLGSGALFFHLRPQRAVLSDLNPALIECYRAVKKRPEDISRRLQRHRKLHSVRHYYRVRDRYNRDRHRARQAADFIYLNKACFNGVFRVNRDGFFNVPWGAKNRPALPCREELLTASGALRRARLRCCDFAAIVDRVGPGDFVYLDPPYPPLNDTAYFRHYTAQRFDGADQRRVAQTFAALASRGCHVLLSNAATREIKSLYRGWRISEIPVRRWVSCKGERFLVNELVVTNF